MTVDPLSDPFRKNKLKHEKTKSFNFAGYESKRSSVSVSQTLPRTDTPEVLSTFPEF